MHVPVSVWAVGALVRGSSFGLLFATAYGFVGGRGGKGFKDRDVNA